MRTDKRRLAGEFNCAFYKVDKRKWVIDNATGYYRAHPPKFGDEIGGMGGMLGTYGEGVFLLKSDAERWMRKQYDAQVLYLARKLANTIAEWRKSERNEENLELDNELFRRYPGLAAGPDD